MFSSILCVCECVCVCVLVFKILYWRTLCLLNEIHFTCEPCLWVPKALLHNHALCYMSAANVASSCIQHLFSDILVSLCLDVCLYTLQSRLSSLSWQQTCRTTSYLFTWVLLTFDQLTSNVYGLSSLSIYLCTFKTMSISWRQNTRLQVIRNTCSLYTSFVTESILEIL